MGGDAAVNSKTVARDLHLRASDSSFEAGPGPEVVGATLALVMVMAGRCAYLEELSGPGVAILAERLG